MIFDRFVSTAGSRAEMYRRRDRVCRSRNAVSILGSVGTAAELGFGMSRGGALGLLEAVDATGKPGKLRDVRFVITDDPVS